MYLVLYNPLSKGSKNKKRTLNIIKNLKKNNIKFILKSVLKITSLPEYINKDERIEEIILLGGDGSINHLANTLIDINPNIPINLISCGTGNDFLRSLKPLKCASTYIPMITYNNTINRYFINGCGIGVDGSICKRTNHLKRKNKIGYLFSSIIELIKTKPYEVEIYTDNSTKKMNKVYFTSIHNGKYIGGGMKMAPKANIKTDELEIIILHSIPKILVLLVFVSVYIGLHTKLSKFVYTEKSKNIKVIVSKPRILQIDGDTYDNVSTLSIKTHNKFLNISSYK